MPSMPAAQPARNGSVLGLESLIEMTMMFVHVHWALTRFRGRMVLRWTKVTDKATASVRSGGDNFISDIDWTLMILFDKLQTLSFRLSKLLPTTSSPTDDWQSLIYIEMRSMHMQTAYTMTLENMYGAAWWRLLQKAMHHTLKPRNENTIHTYLLSHVNTLFIWNENRSKHILSHILSRSLIYCTLFPFEIWNMNSEIVNEIESSSYVLFRTRRSKKNIINV